MNEESSSSLFSEFMIIAIIRISEKMEEDDKKGIKEEEIEVMEEWKREKNINREKIHPKERSAVIGNIEK